MKNKSLYKLFTYAYGVLVISSLCLWYYKTFKVISTPYGDRPHHLVSDLTHIHILIVPFITMILGVLLLDHSFKQFKRKKKIYSGLAMVLFTVLMIISGYIGQVTMEQHLRQQVLTSHAWISVLWSLTYLIHRFFKISYLKKS